MVAQTAGQANAPAPDPVPTEAEATVAALAAEAIGIAEEVVLANKASWAAVMAALKKALSTAQTPLLPVGQPVAAPVAPLQPP